MNVTLLIGIGLGGIAALLDIIGTGIPKWWVHSVLSMGLFRTCVEVIGSTTCAEISSGNLPDWWRATQAMMILSILAMCTGVVLAILFAFVLKDKQMLALGAAFFTFCGAGLALIGVIIFGAKSNEGGLDKYLHAGFGLVIVAAIFAFPASAMMLLAKSRNV